MTAFFFFIPKENKTPWIFKAGGFSFDNKTTQSQGELSLLHEMHGVLKWDHKPVEKVRLSCKCTQVWNERDNTMEKTVFVSVFKKNFRLQLLSTKY